MASIHLTQHARDDLLAIWRYVAEQDLDAADRLIAALEGFCQVSRQQSIVA